MLSSNQVTAWSWTTMSTTGALFTSPSKNICNHHTTRIRSRHYTHTRNHPCSRLLCVVDTHWVHSDSAAHAYHCHNQLKGWHAIISAPLYTTNSWFTILRIIALPQQELSWSLRSHYYSTPGGNISSSFSSIRHNNRAQQSSTIDIFWELAREEDKETIPCSRHCVSLGVKLHMRIPGSISWTLR